MKALIKQLTLFLVMILPFCAANADNLPNASTHHTDSFPEKLRELENQANGRIGICTINTANHQRLQYRADERFPFCSTGKIMVVAAILKNTENNPQLLKKKITYTQQDVEKSGYAPITGKHIDTGMNVAQLSQAAMEYSDNTALNLLLNLAGKPAAVNIYAKSIGDKVFRLDRGEPDLNSAIPGDQRDTTTPQSMGNSLQQLTLGNALQPLQRTLLLDWLKNNTTGNLKIRAGVPKVWIVGDKTGHGNYGTTNDIGVIWPPHCKPIIMVVYFSGNKPSQVDHSDLLASTTRLVIAELAKQDSCVKNAIK